MRTPSFLIGLALLIVVGAATMTALPWNPEMVHGINVKPQKQMLLPPANTLAIGHPRILERDDADKQLTDPLGVSPQAVEQGHVLFDTYCSVCHGANGRGTGPIAKHFRLVADLTSPTVQAYSDGLMYSIIREGGFNMPAYAESLSAGERWAVVRYVRTLRRPS
jgi:cytochrome c5